MKHALLFLKNYLAEINGTNAYARFCSHHLEHHPETPCPTREDFFKAEQERKWKGINRCC